MAKDFEQIGHKNLELLRFYLSKDIKSIDRKLQKDESEVLSCVIASLVDVFVVLLFDQMFEEVISCITKNFWLQVGCKILCVVFLIALFFGIRALSFAVHNYYLCKQEASGKNDYLDERKQSVIDSFDNIACDGLLICKNYINKFNAESEKHVKEFYFYEIIHHLRKAASIYDQIKEHKEEYITSSSKTLDSYRVNNFIEFCNQIFKFIEDNVTEVPSTPDLVNDINNLREDLKHW